MKSSVLYTKSKAFAVRMVRLFEYLTDTRREVILSKQLLRSGTSIGANLAESTRAMSRADYAAKLYIAAKETAETQYWLELLHETGYLTDSEFASVMSDCDELARLLTAATKTLSATQGKPDP